MTIGEKIKKLRKERGMTQEELGKAIGVQKAAINKYETGIVVNLKREIIQSLARELNVSPAWLMDESDGEPMKPVYIPDSDVFRKIMMSLSAKDYETVMEIFTRAEAELRAKGEL